jgi:hypothetical protein
MALIGLVLMAFADRGSIVVSAVDAGGDRLSRYVAVPQATNVARRIIADVCDAALSPRAPERSLDAKRGANGD